MKIVIDKDSGIPLYLQIKHQIKKLLENGSLKKDKQLPTERELSEKLKVSRNTVSMAYKELVLENILLSNPGRGTFLNPKYSNHLEIKVKNNKVKLEEIIDAAINEALELNFELEEFKKILNIRIEQKEKLLKNINIAFIECNYEQLYSFTKGIELGMGISIVSILLDEIRNNPEKFKEKLKSLDLIVTTFFHFDEVKKYLHDKQKKVLTVSLDPLMETMVNIAQVSSPDKVIGLVCITDKFAQRVFKSIKQSGVTYKSFKFITSHDEGKIKKYLDSIDILITSPGRKKEMKKLIPNQIPLIEFIYVPDKGSINILKLAILDLKREGGTLREI